MNKSKKDRENHPNKHKRPSNYTQVKQKLERLKQYEKELEKILPSELADAKTKRRQWPLLTRLLIENLKDRETWALNRLTLAHQEIDTLKNPNSID
jgi:hypothetical protein